MLFAAALFTACETAPKPARTLDLDAEDHVLHSGDRTMLTLTGADEDGTPVEVTAESWGLSLGEDCGRVLGGEFEAAEVDRTCTAHVEARVEGMVGTTTLTVLPPVVEVRTQREGAPDADILTVTPTSAGPEIWAYELFSFEPGIEGVEVSASESCGEPEIEVDRNQAKVTLTCSGERGGTTSFTVHRVDDASATIEAAGPA